MADPDPDSIYRGRSNPGRHRKRRRSSRAGSVGKKNDQLEGAQPRKRTWAPLGWGQTLMVSGLLIVMVGYVGLLGLSSLKNWKKLRTRAAVVVPMVPTESEPVNVPGLVTAEVLTEHIKTWERSRRYIRDLNSYADNPDRTSEAEGHLNRALELDPDNLAIQTMLAGNLLLQDRYGQAASLALQVLCVDPDQANARLTLAHALAGAHAHKETLVMAEWLIREDPIGLAGYRLAAQACLDLKKPTEAIAYMDKILSFEPENFALLIKLAGAYSDLGQHESAIAVLERTMEREGSSSAALFSLASNYARLGDVDQTVRTLSQAADDLGPLFVATWLRSKAFDSIRSDPALAEFLKLVEEQETKTMVESDAVAEP